MHPRTKTRRKRTAAKKRKYSGQVSLTIHDAAKLSEGRVKDVMVEKAFQLALEEYMKGRATARRTLVKELNAATGEERASLERTLKKHDARHRRLNAFNESYVKPFMQRNKRILNAISTVGKLRSATKVAKNLSKAFNK